MITPSNYSSVGVNFVFYDSIARGKLPLGSVSGTSIGSYEHQISAVGGFDTAKIGIVANMQAIEQWIQYGLGRHIEVYSDTGVMIWEGFVDAVEVRAAGISLVRGPLLDIANRVSVMYTPIIDPTADPQVLGTATETVIVDDDESQIMYGIIEDVLSGGNMVDDGTTNDAEYIRDTYLEENKQPKSTSDLSIGESGEVSLMLDCKGYYHLLDKYIYNDGVYNYSVQCTTKILNVLGADPNNFISTDYAEIDDNLALTHGLEDQNRTALTVIKEILTIGDGTDTRWTFGIYGGIKPRYAAVPSTVEYLYSIYSERNELTNTSGKIVRPWEVQPGKWALVPDLLAGILEGTTELKKDPRAIFIESVTFVAPYRVSLRGEPVSTFPQILSRLGYGGMS